MQHFPLEQLKQRLSPEQLRAVLQQLNGRATARFIGLLALLLYWARLPASPPPSSAPSRHAPLPLPPRRPPWRSMPALFCSLAASRPPSPALSPPLASFHPTPPDLARSRQVHLAGRTGRHVAEEQLGSLLCAVQTHFAGVRERLKGKRPLLLTLLPLLLLSVRGFRGWPRPRP